MYICACRYISVCVLCVRRYRSDEWSDALHKEGFEDFRCGDRDPGGDDQYLLASRLRLGGADVRLDRAALHHRLRCSHLLCWSFAHGARPRLLVPHGWTVRRWRRHGIRAHDCAGLRGGGGAGVPTWQIDLLY